MILIRADANEVVGTGHIMRCLSLANAFNEIGEEVVFCTADHRADNLIRGKGYKVICLDSDWTELKEDGIVHVAEDLKPGLILVDSYYITEEYMHKLRKAAPTAYIDDMNSHCWDVDYLINYNIYADNFDYSAYRKSGTELLMGPRYAPLRSEFKGIPKRIVKETVTDILVSAGGADPERITEKIIQDICPGERTIRFHFVVGALNPRINDIKKLQEDNIILHINEKNMSALMNSCDIAISAAGTTLYELCATGLPTITYTLADNQLLPAKAFDEQHVMISADDCRDNSRFIDNLKIAVNNLINDHQLRVQCAQNMQNLVDGNGADRIVKRLVRGNFR